MQERSVAHATRHRLHQFGMRDLIEVALQVRIHDLRMPSAKQRMDGLDSPQCTATRAVGILLGLKIGLKNGFQDLRISLKVNSHFAPS